MSPFDGLMLFLRHQTPVFGFVLLALSLPASGCSDAENMLPIIFEALMHMWLDFLQRNGAARFVQEAMLAFAGRPQLAGCDIDDAVVQTQFDTVVRIDFGQDINGIPETDHRFVMRFDGKHWAVDAGFLQSGIIRADLVEEIHAGLLEPTDVIGVVDDLHLVRFVVLREVDIGFQFIFQKSSSM